MIPSRIFLWVLLAFMAGIAVRSFVAVPVIIIWFLGLVSLVGVVMGVTRRHSRTIFFGCLVLACAGGMLRFSWAEYSRPDLSQFYGRHLELTGVVGEEPVRSEKVQRLKVNVSFVDGARLEPDFFVLATMRLYPRYALGDELRIRGALEEPENFGGFDYVSYLARQDIFATLLFPDVEKLGEGKGSAFKGLLSKIKHAFEENIDRAIAQPHAALVRGLLLGQRESLPPDLVRDFQTTGTSHIVALSGYNITLVGMTFMELLIWITVPFYTAFWVAVSGIVLFVLTVGAAPSVVRAGIMGVLILIAKREGRMYHIKNALAFAGAVMMWVNPMVFRFDAAFQLSFLATLGLVYFSPRIEQLFERGEDRIRRMRGSAPKARSVKLYTDPSFPEEQGSKIKHILIETLSAQLAVLPLLIYLFGRVSLVSPIANVFVLLAVPYAMATGFVTGVLGFFSDTLGAITGLAAWGLLEYILRVISVFAKIPGASVEFDSLVFLPLVGIYAYAGWRFFLRREKKQEQSR